MEGTNSFRPTIIWKEPLKPVGGDSRPWEKLLGQVEISGVPHHIEAWAVVEAEGEQTPVSYETNYDDIMPLTDGPGVTVTIDGHDYFMVVTPHQL